MCVMKRGSYYYLMRGNRVLVMKLAITTNMREMLQLAFFYAQFRLI